jgi:8-oxo-dGTP pyrophosphatase MutT (NUDIX family)
MTTLSSKLVKAVRKAHCCEQCNTMINVGEPAKYNFGIWEGYPFSAYVHLECKEAADAYAELNDLWFEDYPWFQFMDNSEHDHHAWLLENHPIVAARLGVKAPRREEA